MNHPLALLAGVALALPTAALGAPPPQRPNVLVILADDLGYADIGVHGARDIRTPAIDSLARSGVRFSNAYASGPVCSPTRAGLMTGRYQNRFGHEFNPGPRPHPAGWGLPPTEKTLAGRLKAAGYATGLVGKWHLGIEPAFHPLKYGFDEFFGFMDAGHSYVDSKADPVNPILRGTTPVTETEYLTDAFRREAIRFVDANARHPWFLYLAFNAVHAPMQATPAYLDRHKAIADGKRRAYAAMLSAMDDAIGAVLDRLRALGLEERTIVFFLGDNGGSGGSGASNVPLRGAKSQTWEGGIRVPLIVQWKSVIPAGKVYGHPVIQLDVVPTALAAAGKTAPGLDGVDLIPFVTDRNKRPPHEALFWRMGDQMAIRTDRWKLVKSAGRRDKPTRADVVLAGAQLFDLAADPSEQHDLAARNPAMVRKLAAAWTAWDAQLPRPRWLPAWNR